MHPQRRAPGAQYQLPPLILHPFADAGGPDKLVESSRASLILQGLVPNNDVNTEELERTLFEGRICEVRMLFYVGKDVMRWIGQCCEFATREPRLRNTAIRPQSFVSLLIDDAPLPVKDKLDRWGVIDFKAIFSRAVGLNAVFGESPERIELSREFIEYYYRYADALFECYRSSCSYAPLRSSDFDFELFASGEYSRMLAREWQEK